MANEFAPEQSDHEIGLVNLFRLTSDAGGSFNPDANVPVADNPDLAERVQSALSSLSYALEKNYARLDVSPNTQTRSISLTNEGLLVALRGIKNLHQR